MEKVVYENEYRKITVRVNEDHIQITKYFGGDIEDRMSMYIDEFRLLNSVVEELYNKELYR